MCPRLMCFDRDGLRDVIIRSLIKAERAAANRVVNNLNVGMSKRVSLEYHNFTPSSLTSLQVTSTRSTAIEHNA